MPEGFGPYDMPPPMVAATGNTRAESLKLICVATVMSGSPLITRFETEQLLGAIMRLALMEPSPELLRVPSISPPTATAGGIVVGLKL